MINIPKYITSRDQKGEAKTSPVTVMFVPRTPGGELISRLREAEMEISKVVGDRIKFAERSGRKMKGIFHKANSLAGENCGRKDCLVCQYGEEGNGDCRWRSVCYKTTCLACLEKGRKVEYYGESSRTAFERGKEHQADFLSKSDDSHMYKHVSNDHGEKEQVKFSMKVLKKHMSAFHRQVTEAVLIHRNEMNDILNSKGEYNRCNLPRLTVKLGNLELEYLEEGFKKRKSKEKK